VPLNKLLYDEQVALIHAAEASANGSIPGLRPLSFKPSLSGYRQASSLTPDIRPPILAKSFGSTQSLVELSWAQVAAVDRWAHEWDVTRSETIDRLILRGGGGSTHLMRSS
jgi:hypothetical protein